MAGPGLNAEEGGGNLGQEGRGRRREFWALERTGREARTEAEGARAENAGKGIESPGPGASGSPGWTAPKRELEAGGAVILGRAGILSPLTPFPPP